MAPLAPGPALVMGAGAVGCFVGGRLAAAGVEVHFVGRPRVLAALATNGLTLSDLDGAEAHVDPGALRLHATVPSGIEPGLVLLCVKSGATAVAARELAVALPTGTPVLSLQNGVTNAQTVSHAAPGLLALPGMVPFNVVNLSPGHFHRGTTGTLAAQDHPALRAWLPVFDAAGLPLQLHADLRAVLWGKLLLNLNNPVNALSGLPLRAQLLDRDHRRVLAALQDEALAVLKAAGIQPAQLTPLPPQRLPAVLRLPNWLFERIAARLLRIDSQARSSMADDLALGRRTEVDALCGELVRLAAAHGASAPLNERIAQLVEAWPAEPRPRSGAELRAELGLG